MSKIHLVFMGLFLITMGINLYAIRWDLGIFHSDNSAYLYSVGFGVIGVLASLIFSTLRQISKK